MIRTSHMDGLFVDVCDLGDEGEMYTAEYPTPEGVARLVGSCPLMVAANVLESAAAAWREREEKNQ